MSNDNASFGDKVKNFFIGRALDVNNKDLFKNISLIAFFAWIGLGSDLLSSSCYGPQEAFISLGKHSHLILIVAILSVITIYVVSASYNQIVSLFPSGGGGYLVASKLLSPTVGMISGCALLIDYVLTITLSVASGADALFSLLPPNLLEFKLIFTLSCIGVLTILNLRGIKESITILAPIFLFFVFTHIVAIGYAIFHHINNVGLITESVIAETQSSYSELGLYGFGFMIMKAFSLGAGTFTGIEAVSNAMPMLSEPKVKTARKTMSYMAFSLSFMLIGLMMAYLLFNVQNTEGKTLNAVLFEGMTKDWGVFGKQFVWLLLLSEACLLFVAAQTGFLDGPRILSNMAVDKWFPQRFGSLSDRLVTENGILLMSFASLCMILISKGSVGFLVVLFSINVFITFVLSQLGMVIHWWGARKTEKGWFGKLLINGTGFTVCLFILITVIIMKFDEGGWITIIITGIVIVFAIYIRHHYNVIDWLLKKLDVYVENADKEMEHAIAKVHFKPEEVIGEGKTAVILVRGYNGQGIMSLIHTITLFDGTFDKYVFVEIGILNVRTFKGLEELQALEKSVSDDLDKYVALAKRHGFKSESIKLLGTNVVEETIKEAFKIQKKYPNCVFFGGQLVFPRETFRTRYLHNHAAFALQKRFYQEGIPFVILPTLLGESEEDMAKNIQ